ncbi:MAG: PASTA domain-containing protein, partial [Candidatus Limnocylindrales bacterium]
EVFHANVAAGDAIKTTPAAGETVEVGSTVTVNISKGIKQVTVPGLIGLAESEVEAALTDAELKVGARSQAENEAAPGTVIDQSPAEGAEVDRNSTVDYAVSSGPAVEQMGLGGDLDSSEVMSQLDVIASQVEPIRELELANTPYDGSNARQHQLALAERIDILRDPDAIQAEERALKRLGLLDDSDDLAELLERLYGQPLPVAYFEDDGHLSVLEDIDALGGSERAQAAREMDRALVDQAFGLESSRIGDKSIGDEALAVYALEQGDGTAAMIDWAAAHGNKNRTNDVIVPGDDAVFASMPLILQREYSLPFLEGRIFVDRLQDSGGWAAVNAAWGRPPESTEQILHPKLYPDERPTTVVMDGIAGRLGDGWTGQWQQTMGELRIGVWLANGAAGEQSGPRAAVKLPRANAAAGWGGDRLVSLNGPDGQWAIVWQTKWDSQQDIDQFVNAADQVIADLDGAGLVTQADVSSGVSNPALVLIASSDETLASVAEAFGVTVASPN